MSLDISKLVELQQEIIDLTKQYNAIPHGQAQEREVLVGPINEKAKVLFAMLLDSFETDPSEETQMLVSDLFAGCFDDKDTCAPDDLQALGVVLPYAIIRRLVSNEKSPILLYDLDYAEVSTRFKPLVLNAKSRDFTDQIARYPEWAKARGFA